MKFGGPLEIEIAIKTMCQRLLSLKRKILMKNLKKIENNRLINMDIIEMYQWLQSLAMYNRKRITTSKPLKSPLKPQIKI